MQFVSRIKSLCFALFVLGAVVSLPSCFRCMDVECDNGTCSQGVCECYDGYYGSECQYSSTASGYDCVSGSCVYTSDNASYSSISECQDYCASNCSYDVFNGGGSCLDAGNFPVSASWCCSPTYPFFCPETGSCYTTCEAADAACAAATVVTGAANGSSGYACASGNCNYVTNGASYSTLAACEASCGGGGSAGYDCVGGTCNYVSSGADYSTQSACESACGGNNCSWDQNASCLTIVTVYDNGCGNQSTFRVTLTNNCNTAIKVYWCLRDVDGTWNTTADPNFNLGIAPGATNYHYVCEGTGEYNIWTMPVSEYYANGSCAWPSCD